GGWKSPVSPSDNGGGAAVAVGTSSVWLAASACPQKLQNRGRWVENSTACEQCGHVTCMRTGWLQCKAACGFAGILRSRKRQEGSLYDSSHVRRDFILRQFPQRPAGAAAQVGPLLPPLHLLHGLFLFRLGGLWHLW